MKQKTHKGTQKRIKITGSGKVMFAKAARKHLLSSKKKQMSKNGNDVQAPKGHMKRLSRLLNISKKRAHAANDESIVSEKAA